MTKIARTIKNKPSKNRQADDQLNELLIRRRKLIIKKLTIWILFNVLVALLPFLFRYLGATFSGQMVNLQNILSDGELLLVAAAVASGALGDLIASNQEDALPRVIVGGLCILSLLLSSLCYAFVSALGDLSIAQDTLAISQWSIWIFTSAFATGTGCIILTEAE